MLLPFWIQIPVSKADTTANYTWKQPLYEEVLPESETRQGWPKKSCLIGNLTRVEDITWSRYAAVKMLGQLIKQIGLGG